MATRLLPPGYQELLSTGAIAAGAKLYTYAAGTSTPKASYSDSGLTVPNANPVVADGSGRFGETFATTGQYRLVMKTSADVTLWTADPVDGENVLGETLTTNLAIVKADPGFALSATSGNAFIEVSAASGSTAYIDLQVPEADNFDLRMSSTGTGGAIYSSSSLTLVPLSGSSVVAAGDVRTYQQSAVTNGALYFGDTGSNGLAYNGSAYTLAGGNLTVSAGLLADSKGNTRTLPNNAQTGAYVAVLGDVGKLINITTGGVTVNTGIFSVGDVFWIYNNSGSSQTITQGASVTMRLAGSATTGSRTLAQRGIMRVLCVAAGEFVTDGTGVT